MSASLAIRARILSFDGDPRLDPAAVCFIEDGLVTVRDGLVEAVGEASALLPALDPATRVVDHRPHLLLPGFVDPHIHMPQTQVVASYGTELLEWLQRYTFPEESRYGDAQVCDEAARFVLAELLRNGTTTASFFCTSHPQSVDSLLAHADRLGLRMLAGKVMMDRGAPEALLDTPERGYAETSALIERWHGRGRLEVAITPRFAPTSTEGQLEAVKALAGEHPGLAIQTHLSENRAEIDYVRELFPWASDYLAVYERYDMVRERALFGHAIHLTERERASLAERGASAIFCPTSNLFLGSGLFDRAGLIAAGVRTGIATDIGGGTSYSMLATAGEGYKALALRGEKLPARQAFHWMTAGNAAAIGLGHRIGRIAPGFEADFALLDSRATSAMRRRMARVETLDEELFLLMTMGDDRAVAATYAGGRCVHRRGGLAGSGLPAPQDGGIRNRDRVDEAAAAQQ